LLSGGKNNHFFKLLLFGTWLFKFAYEMFQHFAPIEELGSDQLKNLTKDTLEQD
jgi:hypothetical protein